MKSFLNAERVDILLQELEKYFLLRGGDHGLNYEIFKEIKDTISLMEKSNIRIRVYFPVREQDYFSMAGVDTNNLKTLSLGTNWKRLRIVSEVFDANASSANPNLHIRLSLGLIVCKSIKSNNGLKGHSKVDIHILEDSSFLWRHSS